MNDAAIAPMAGNAPAAAAAAAAPHAGGYRMTMRFTGSGSEYFRIWIVNLLLILVTIGLYYPFAKVRRLRYFYGNTKLGGEEFDFHGNPWKMLRGFLLMAALLGAYGLATNASPWAALVALLLLAGIWPALFRASMQFRLANTSWRGLRFHFEGTLGSVYRALAPMLVLLVMYLGAFGFIAPQGDQPPQAAPNSVAVALTGLGGVLVALLTPWFWYTIKRYQHGHYALGPVRTELRAGAGGFYSIFLKASGIGLLLVLPLIALGAWLALSLGRPGGAGSVLRFALAVPLLMMLCYLAMLVVVGSFITARMQNLVWSNTRSRELRFVSRVPVGALIKLTTKNWLLIGLTLGLYVPFARVARTRLLLESMEVLTRHPPEVLTAALRGMGGDGAGDASADLLGFDVGL